MIRLGQSVSETFKASVALTICKIFERTSSVLSKVDLFHRIEILFFMNNWWFCDGYSIINIKPITQQIKLKLQLTN